MIMKKLTFILGLFLASTLAFGASAQQRFALHDKPREIADVRFVDEAGKKMSLSDFKGQVLLVNIWATWCPPCVKEMPTLDRLQGEIGRDQLKVLTLSIDRAGVPAVRSFFDKIKVTNLDIHVDSTMLAATALGAFGLPATLLIDREGRELGRLVGPAEWDDPAMIAFLRELTK